MKITEKKNWVFPSVKTVQQNQINGEIFVSACSGYHESCHPSIAYLDSTPGKPPVEIM